MKPAKQRTHWLILAVATVVLVAGVVAANVSSSPVIIPLTLSVGRSVTVSVFHLLPGHYVLIQLEFHRDMPDGFEKRADLGDSRSTKGAGSVEFELPGERVVIQVRGAAGTTNFEALPAGGYSFDTVYRELVPRVSDDGNPRRFPWPPDNAARPRLPVGTSTLTLTVVEVGKLLAGEKITAILIPPVTEKFVSPNYGFLWWFLVLWPAMAAVLACYAAYLVWQAMRSRVATNDG